MKNINKTLQISANNSQDPEQAIHCYLENYCSTPHPALQTSLATIMFQGPQYHTHLPELNATYQGDCICQNDQVYKNNLQK